ncbi:hypothetical protein ACOBV9_19320 (plasmid) [Pseudoalteromonas espejiana]
MEQFSQYVYNHHCWFWWLLLLYVVATALFFTGCGYINTAAGALFGLVEGLLVASFASTVGATLVF